MSFSELNSRLEIEDKMYMTSEEAFFGNSIFQFVADEVNSMLQIIFMNGAVEFWGCGFIRSFYNPLYLLLFVLLYLVTFPGALLHYLLFDCMPVRLEEMPEERELRSQGIYMALGISFYCIIFGAIGLLYGNSSMVMINEIALASNVALIIINLIGLKAMGEEFVVTIRTYIIGIWLLVLTLIGLALFDAYKYITALWITLFDYIIRIFQIFIYIVIAVNLIEFWNFYGQTEASKELIQQNNCLDIFLTLLLIILFCGIYIGFIIVVEYAEDDAWRILLW
jgi:hypothetical protein